MLPAVFAEEPLLAASSPGLDAARLTRLGTAMAEIEADGTAARLRAGHGL